jgi:hypothetical protein
MGRRTLLQNRLRSLYHDKAGWGEATSGLQPFDLAEKNPPLGRAFRRRANWKEGIDPKHGHQLMDSFEKDLHVFTVGLGKL